METAFFIAGFGALGCLSRYFLSIWVYGFTGKAYPFGTFVVNVLGSFLIGMVMEFSLRSTAISNNLRIGLTVGFMGGLTTFSSFSLETFRLLEDGQLAAAFANILLSVTVCLVFTWIGVTAGRQI
jgi:fluoride exporter